MEIAHFLSNPIRIQKEKSFDCSELIAHQIQYENNGNLALDGYSSFLLTSKRNPQEYGFGWTQLISY